MDSMMHGDVSQILEAHSIQQDHSNTPPLAWLRPITYCANPGTILVTKSAVLPTYR